MCAAEAEEQEGPHVAKPPVSTFPSHDTWQGLIWAMRALTRRCFWELFAGAFGLSMAFVAEGWRVAPPIDVVLGPSNNLLNPMFASVVLGLLLEDRVAVLRMSPPACAPRLGPAARRSLLGAAAEATASFGRAQHKAKGAFQVEVPLDLALISTQGLAELLAETNAAVVRRGACVDSAPWRQPTLLISADHRVRALQATCPGGHVRRRLRGRAPDGRKWAYAAAAFWPGVARIVAQHWGCVRDADVELCKQRAAGWIDASGADMREIVQASGFMPSGRRAADSASRKVAAAMQPVRRALPQLVPDGMSPDARVAALECLAGAVRHEDEKITPFFQPWLRPALGRRSLAFIREVSFFVMPRGRDFLADDLRGLPKIGWAPSCPAAPPRPSPPLKPIEELVKAQANRNQKIFKSTRSSGDDALDRGAWRKTKEEFEQGVMLGPFGAEADVPADFCCFFRRFPLRERRGGAAGPSCRAIDDMLEGGHNDTAGTSDARVPSGLDMRATQIRVAAERFGEALLGHASDFAKAYRQQTADPATAHFNCIVVYDPERRRPVLALPVAQLFGGKNSPLNLARIPMCCVECTALLFGAAYTHRVDDMLNVERATTAWSCWRSWRNFAQLCGWDVPDVKSPPPSAELRALGAWTDLRPAPGGSPLIKIADERAQELRKDVFDCLHSWRLRSGHASRLVDRLGFASTQLFGRRGRAQLRSFVRRAHEPGRAELNPQMASALRWWAEALLRQRPREVLTDPSSLDWVLSYSDGEGSEAGIGVVLWSSRLPVPEAGRIVVPRELRHLWHPTLDTDPLATDVYEVEALGPILILDENWLGVMQGSLWLHFIDKEGALSCLVKGASSVFAGEAIAGMTWARIASQKVWAWFDRAASASDVVDGLSRGDWTQPWKYKPIVLPRGLHAALGEAHGSSASARDGRGMASAKRCRG
ncbi:unnamed protein product [Prorocentrum cordatum]|uniref:Uncharacterized protein n=1 Tax=Prorocentrum cordatum TaxID=2364126 RepID=A0ABN9TD28_9DINO|nr:unnamed protein product [Polarella glacialis]